MGDWNLVMYQPDLRRRPPALESLVSRDPDVIRHLAMLHAQDALVERVGRKLASACDDRDVARAVVRAIRVRYQNMRYVLSRVYALGFHPYDGGPGQAQMYRIQNMHSQLKVAQARARELTECVYELRQSCRRVYLDYRRNYQEFMRETMPTPPPVKRPLSSGSPVY